MRSISGRSRYFSSDIVKESRDQRSKHTSSASRRIIKRASGYVGMSMWCEVLLSIHASQAGVEGGAGSRSMRRQPEAESCSVKRPDQA